jgi:dTMP kinase
MILSQLGQITEKMREVQGYLIYYPLLVNFNFNLITQTRDMFITFEGLDSSGKTTQAVLLVKRLEQSGRKVLFLREPGGTAISEMVRKILLDNKHTEMSMKAELFLFSAARTQLVSEVIQPALKEGKIVISDRFYDSTTAYQGYGRELSLDEIHAINRIATNGTSPDLTLFIDVAMEELINRKRLSGSSADRMESSGRAFYERVRQGYLAIAKECPSRVIPIDGNLPVETIHEHIWQIIAGRLS